MSVHADLLEKYCEIVGSKEIDEIKDLAERVKGASIVHVNSTRFGGGVAEILKSMIPLANSVGLKASWHVIEGSEDFFDVTKSFHNALQGMDLKLTESMKETYLRYNEINAEKLPLDADVYIIHDPQPAAMISFIKNRVGRWIWRCHIDVTEANQTYWGFLRNYLEKYDSIVFSLDRYIKDDVKHKRIFIIPPSLNPLSDKNRMLTDSEVSNVLSKFDVDANKPVLTQVARFDYWKDPLGVVDVYRKVKSKFPNLQLLLIGILASDDPEGMGWYRKTKEYAGNDRDVHILSNLDGVLDLEVNAFQRASSVAVQMSIREGFGITVTEALWKGVPVVATRTGGIPLQVINDVTGYLVNSKEEAAEKVEYLLKQRDVARQLGIQGREHVKRNFLITRHLKQYTKLVLEIL